MATTLDFIEYVCDQIGGAGSIRFKKMFGEFMVYVNDKPIFLVCDNTVFVKCLDPLATIMVDSERGIPYKGAKEQYILDIDNGELSREVVEILESITPLPKPRKKKSDKSVV